MSGENPDLKPCRQSSEPSANLDQRLCSRTSADQSSLTKRLVSTSFSPILASLGVTALLAAAPELAIGQT